MPRSIEERFWQKVEKRGEDECWPWLAAVSKKGYGAFQIGTLKQSRVKGAHIFAYELVNGPILAGLLVCHSCDNPPCCNPKHLWLGTNADNQKDKMHKGRYKAGEKSIGSKNGNAKLTEDQVIEIRERHDNGESFRGLARIFRCSKTTIKYVCEVGWRHCK